MAFISGIASEGDWEAIKAHYGRDARRCGPGETADDVWFMVFLNAPPEDLLAPRAFTTLHVKPGCPACPDRGQPAGDEVEIDNEFAIQHCWCNICGCTWIDRYRLSFQTDIVPEEQLDEVIKKGDGHA